MSGVSLSYELATLERAVAGAEALLELEAEGGLHEDADLVRSASAILALVGCRLRDLGRVGRGTMPSELFLAPHNAAVNPGPGGDPDVVLGAVASPSRSRRQRR